MDRIQGRGKVIFDEEQMDEISTIIGIPGK